MAIVSFLQLAGGLYVGVPEGGQPAEVRGVSAEGYVVIESASLPGYLIALTPCCGASGKGSGNVASGVCCRACYAEVSPSFGGFAEVAVAVAS